MANFDEASVSTLQHEGQYTDHKDDRGGETYCGISRRWHPAERVWAHIDGHKQHPGFRSDPNSVINHKMLASMVTDFYKREFWNKIKGDDIPSQKIANYLYDIAVNKGVKDSSTYLQIGCGISNRNGRDWPDIKPDGNIGDKTIAALTAWINKRGEWPCLLLLGANILAHWQSQAIKHPSQEEFINGILVRHVAQAAIFAEEHFSKRFCKK